MLPASSSHGTLQQSKQSSSSRWLVNTVFSNDLLQQQCSSRQEARSLASRRSSSTMI
jgi:hypothetical protein